MAAYGTLCTHFYDLDKPAAPPDALAFYLRRAQDVGGRILEPMCGSGRFLLPMTQAGVLVDGVDSSAAMLAACRAHARRLCTDVSVFLQDLASMELPHKHSMAFIPSGSIGLITRDEELVAVFARIRAQLNPGCSLLLELACDDTPFEGCIEAQPRTVNCADGSSITYKCTAARTTESDNIRYSGEYTRLRGNQVVEMEEEVLELRLYGAQTIISKLAACGFDVAKVSSARDLAFLAASGCTLIEAY